jgi:hypothetical protein
MNPRGVDEALAVRREAEPDRRAEIAPWLEGVSACDVADCGFPRTIVAQRCYNDCRNARTCRLSPTLDQSRRDQETR